MAPLAENQRGKTVALFHSEIKYFNETVSTHLLHVSLKQEAKLSLG